MAGICFQPPRNAPARKRCAVVFLQAGCSWLPNPKPYLGVPQRKLSDHGHDFQRQRSTSTSTQLKVQVPQTLTLKLSTSTSTVEKLREAPASTRLPNKRCIWDAFVCPQHRAYLSGTLVAFLWDSRSDFFRKGLFAIVANSCNYFDYCNYCNYCNSCNNCNSCNSCLVDLRPHEPNSKYPLGAAKRPPGGILSSLGFVGRKSTRQLLQLLQLLWLLQLLQ